MISFLLKSSFVIVLLLAFYKMVLEKESFFSKNRMYLLGCLFLTFSLPFLTLPELVNNQGIVSTTIEKHIEKEPVVLPNDPIVENQITEQPISNQEIKNEVPSIDNNKIVENPESNSESIVSAESPTPHVSTTSNSEKKGVLYWLLMIYLFGVVIFSLNFISQIASVIFKIIKSEDRIEDTDCTIINSPRMTEPCSFFKYIFINPESYDYETYEQILAHERVHVKLNHTWDLILSEIVVIVMWFNPFAWVLRKEIEKNIEYQTDDYLLSEQTVEKEVYQMNLLKVATYNHPLTVVTNYNQSLIKQRILRINAKRSNLHSYWKYAFVAPLLFGITLLLNRPNLVLAQSESILPTIEDASISNMDDVINTADKPINEIPQKGLTTNNTETSNNENVNSILTDDNEEGLTDCEKLLKAAKKNNVNKVRKLLQTFNPGCLPYADKQDYLNLNFIKSYVDNGAKIYIDQNDNDITIEDLQVIFKGDEILDLLNDNDQYGVLISRKKCGEVWKAAEAGDFKKFNQLFSQLERDCIVNGTGDDFALFEHLKKLAAKDVPLDIGTFSFVIKADELIANDNSPNSVLNLKRATKFDSVDLAKTTDSDGCLDLLNAIQAGNLNLIVKLLETVDPNCAVKDSYKAGSTTISGLQTPLVYAARSGNIKIGELLIDADADVEYHVYNTESPIEVAFDNGNSNFVQLLIEHGANSNQVKTTITIDNSQTKSNHSSNSSDVISLLNAARSGKLEVVKYFLGEGINVNSVVPNNGSPLSAAAQSGELKVVKYLISPEGAEVNLIIENVGTALTMAAQNGNLEIVKYLISQGANANLKVENVGTALTRAAQNGALTTVKYLISQGLDINQSLENVGTALIKAAQNGELETVKYLISKGAKIDFITRNVGSALYVAAQNGELKTVKYLHDQGADLNLVIPNRGTAMSAAAQNGELLTLKYLRKHSKKN